MNLGKIKEVFVEIGDTVVEDDILFTLEPPEDVEELDRAFDILEDLNFQKEKMLLSMDDPEYETEQRAITKLRQALNDNLRLSYPHL